MPDPFPSLAYGSCARGDACGRRGEGEGGRSAWPVTTVSSASRPPPWHRDDVHEKSCIQRTQVTRSRSLFSLNMDSVEGTRARVCGSERHMDTVAGIPLKMDGCRGSGGQRGKRDLSHVGGTLSKRGIRSHFASFIVALPVVSLSARLSLCFRRAK